MKFKKLFLISPIFFFLTLRFIESNFAKENNNNNNNNSIIKYFCIKNVKSEFKISNVEYSDILGEEICNCYMKNISGNTSHEESISNCKLENKEKFNLP